MEQERATAAARSSKRERIEKKLVKEESIAVCYVCNSGDHFEDRGGDQEIVFCERCCVAVHSSCYGLDAEEVRKAERGRESEGAAQARLSKGGVNRPRAGAGAGGRVRALLECAISPPSPF